MGPSRKRWFGGVDIGTSSCKVLLLDETGAPRIESARSYPLLHPEHGHAEQDPDVILEAVVDALGAAIAQTESIPVAALGFSSAMHSVLVLDRQMRPLTPLITWADARSEAEAAHLRSQTVGQDIFRTTGTPIHPMAPLAKLMWMQTHRPEWLENAHKIVSIKEYVIYRLFGVLVVDHSIASATGLFDLFHRSWYAPALRQAGIRADQLAKPVPAHYRLPAMDAAFADRIGLPADTPCIVGASDGCLANLGVLALNPSEAALTIGTSGAVRVTSREPRTDPKGRLFTYLLDDEHVVIGGAISNGGILLQWFRKQLLGDEGGEIDIDRWLRNAGALPPGSDGLLCLPYLLGERAPHWNSFDRGVFFGVQYHHTAVHFLRAILEGVAMTLRQITDALEETCGPIDIVHVNGGFVRSREWLQILADVLDKKLVISATREASATGAAYMAMQAFGNQLPAPAFDGSSNRASARTIKPDPDAHAVYENLMPLFNDLYTRLHPAFERL